MIGRIWQLLKQVVAALLLLAVLPCVAEVGLRLYEFYASGHPESSFEQPDLIAASLETHHQLKPLQRIHRTSNETGGSYPLATNSFGLRGPEVSVPKPTGVYRIVCLGDETTLGIETPEADTFCRRLQGDLQSRSRIRVEVINAGIPRYCPLLSYLQLRHRLLILQPDLIILNFDLADVSIDCCYRRHTVVGADDVPLACPHPSFDLVRSAHKPQLADQFLTVQWGMAQARRFMKQRLNEDDARNDADSDGGSLSDDSTYNRSLRIQRTLAAVDQLNQLTKSIDAWLILAAYSSSDQQSRSATDRGSAFDESAGSHDADASDGITVEVLEQNALKRGIVFCNVAQALARAGDQPIRIRQADSKGLTAHGHDLYARQLADCLIRQLPSVFGANAGSWTQAPAPSQVKVR